MYILDMVLPPKPTLYTHGSPSLPDKNVLYEQLSKVE